MWQEVNRVAEAVDRIRRREVGPEIQPKVTAKAGCLDQADLRTRLALEMNFLSKVDHEM